MQLYGKWKIIRELGEGGQGKVYLAYNTERFDPDQIGDQLARQFRGLSPAYPDLSGREAVSRFARTMLRLGDSEKNENLGALKVLHLTPDNPAHAKQLARLRDEVTTLSAIRHPNIIPILDRNMEKGWFVTQYFPEGPLSQHRERYCGNVLGALNAFRPLVEAVAKLHENHYVHRDIKPGNVFLSNDGRLILGDLGLVYFENDERTRLTDTFERVGSRDWMPAWALTMRLEEVKPTFDVFCLGKLLWAMVSGRPLLALWYHRDPRFDLETMFPASQEVKWVQLILDKCVVERESDCIADAKDLLSLVDSTLGAVSRNAQVVAEGVERTCQVCGLGKYVCVADEKAGEVSTFGLEPKDGRTFKVFSCNHCGHSQLFYMPAERPAWRKQTD